MSLLDNLKHMVLTDDDPALNPEVAVRVDKARIPSPGVPKINFFNASAMSYPTSNPPPQIQTSNQAMNSQQQLMTAGLMMNRSDDNNFAQTLKAKTDFDSTDVGKQVAHEMKPLEGIGSLSETDKINIALKAGAEEGLTAEKIIATFDSLLASLEAENSGFQAACASATQTGPESIKNEIQRVDDMTKDLEKQIDAANQHKRELASDLITADAKIQRNTMQFNAAYQARKAELNTAKSHYQTILQGIK